MNLVITVKQPGVCQPRVYKTTTFDRQPNIDELRAIGADIVVARGDVVTLDIVSDALYAAINQARWIRP